MRKRIASVILIFALTFITYAAGAFQQSGTPLKGPALFLIKKAWR
jgi:hypothetical protein